MRARSVCFFAAGLAALVLAAPSARATVFTYQALLDGPTEFPVNASPGTGFAQVLYDDVNLTLTISATFRDLLGITSAAHIHAVVPDAGNPVAGVAVLPPSLTGFPLGVSAGSMPATAFDLTQASTYNAGFITANGGTTTGARNALIAAMNNSPPHPTLPSRAYFNIHTSPTFGGGEIRGFLVLVPEPATVGMAGTMLMGLVALVRRRRA